MHPPSIPEEPYLPNQIILELLTLFCNASMVALSFPVLYSSMPVSSPALTQPGICGQTAVKCKWRLFCKPGATGVTAVHWKTPCQNERMGMIVWALLSSRIKENISQVISSQKTTTLQWLSLGPMENIATKRLGSPSLSRVHKARKTGSSFFIKGPVPGFSAWAPSGSCIRFSSAERTYIGRIVKVSAEKVSPFGFPSTRSIPPRLASKSCTNQAVLLIIPSLIRPRSLFKNSREYPSDIRYNLQWTAKYVQVFY